MLRPDPHQTQLFSATGTEWMVLLIKLFLDIALQVSGCRDCARRTRSRRGFQDKRSGLKCLSQFALGLHDTAAPDTAIGNQL